MLQTQKQMQYTPVPSRNSSVCACTYHSAHNMALHCKSLCIELCIDVCALLHSSVNFLKRLWSQRRRECMVGEGCMIFLSAGFSPRKMSWIKMLHIGSWWGLNIWDVHVNWGSSLNSSNQTSDLFNNMMDRTESACKQDLDVTPPLILIIACQNMERLWLCCDWIIWFDWHKKSPYI